MRQGQEPAAAPPKVAQAAEMQRGSGLVDDEAHAEAAADGFEEAAIRSDALDGADPDRVPARVMVLPVPNPLVWRGTRPQHDRDRDPATAPGRERRAKQATELRQQPPRPGAFDLLHDADVANRVGPARFFAEAQPVFGCEPRPARRPLLRDRTASQRT